jgi:hypothetical protein
MGKLITPLSKIRRLEIFYMATIGVLMIIVVSTPFFVRRWIAETNRLLGEQEVMETLLIAVLLSLAYTLSRIYKAIIKTHREEIQRLAMNNTTLQCRLTEAFNYIGNVNVQLQEIRSAFSLLNRLPQNRNDFKNLLRVFAQKALTIANTDWLAVRIIDRQSLRTVIEHLESRRKGIALNPHIANKSIVEGEPIAGLVVIRCENENLDTTVACIFSRNELTWEEKTLLEAIAGEIELFFIAFASRHPHGIDSTMARLPHQAKPSDRFVAISGSNLNKSVESPELKASRACSLTMPSRSDRSISPSSTGMWLPWRTAGYLNPRWADRRRR